MKIFEKRWVFMLIATALLCSNFYGHMFSSLPLKRFLNNEFPSEAHVITRLAYNDAHGKDSRGGFMLYTEATKPLFMAAEQEPYRDARQNILEDEEAITLYPSHIGFQDDLLYPIWSSLFSMRDRILADAREGSRWQERMAHYDLYYVVRGTQFFVALLNAFVIGLLLLWVKREFSSRAAYITLGLVCVLLADLTFFGRAMWWMMGIWFLPFIVMAFAYARKDGAPQSPLPLLIASAIAGGFLSLKTSMGYEYTSTIMMSAVIPVTYYAIARRWSFKTWFIQCIPVGAFQLGGLAATLYLHYEALQALGMDPLEVLRYRFEMRSNGGAVAGDLDGMMGRSVEANVLSVWAGYLFTYKNMGLPQIILMLPLVWFLFMRRRDWRIGFTDNLQTRALLACIGLAFIGALSMFTILKGHAYIHSFDTVAWSIPMNILLMTFYARWILAGNLRQ